MQVKLRLQRFGSKKRPFYRIVAAPNTKKRDGRFLEIIGLYHPISAEASQVRLDKTKVQDWLSKGAEPSPQVKQILVKEKIWQEYAVAKEQRRVARIKKNNAKKKSAKTTATPAAASTES